MDIDILASRHFHSLEINKLRISFEVGSRFRHTEHDHKNLGRGQKSA